MLAAVVVAVAAGAPVNDRVDDCAEWAAAVVSAAEAEEAEYERRGWADRVLRVPGAMDKYEHQVEILKRVCHKSALARWRQRSDRQYQPTTNILHPTYLPGF